MHEHHQPQPSVLDLKRIEDDQQLSFSTRSIPLLARRITNKMQFAKLQKSPGISTFSTNNLKEKPRKVNK
jgi:hypothetical protein